MLTITPKKGDEVLIVETRTHRDTFPKTVQVELVGKKYLHVLGEKFDFEGRHVSNFPCYSLWDSQEAYDRTQLRRRNIVKIQKIVIECGFLSGLSDERLQEILDVLEVKP